MAISYMEDRSPIVFGQKMYVMRPLYAPNIQGCTIGAGNALLVYQQGQDVWFWLGEENCGRKVGDIPDSRSSTLGVTLSVQIQITIILGEKGVVRPPERHP